MQPKSSFLRRAAAALAGAFIIAAASLPLHAAQPPEFHPVGSTLEVMTLGLVNVYMTTALIGSSGQRLKREEASNFLKTNKNLVDAIRRSATGWGSNPEAPKELKQIFANILNAAQALQNEIIALENLIATGNQKYVREAEEWSKQADKLIDKLMMQK